MWTTWNCSGLFLSFRPKSWNTERTLVLLLPHRTKMNHNNKREGLSFCKACWLRLSGIHHWRFGSRCLAFPFHWLNGQAGLCLAPSHLPSRFFFFLWREVSRRVLLIWGGAVESPVPPILPRADGGDESWPRRCPLTAHSQTPCSSPDVYPRLDSVENTAWISWRRGESLPIPSPVLFSGWSSVGTTWCPFFTSSRVVYHSSSSVLSFSKRKQKPRTEGDKIFRLRFNCGLELIE